MDKKLEKLSAALERRTGDLRLWTQTVLGFSILGYFLLAALILLRTT